MGGSIQRVGILVVGILIAIIGLAAAGVMARPPVISPTQPIPTPPGTNQQVARSISVLPSAGMGQIVEGYKDHLQQAAILLAALIAGGLGLAALLRRRQRRRMAYTDQNIAMLLAAADQTTRNENLRVIQDLADKGLLTPELAQATGIALPHKKVSK